MKGTEVVKLALQSTQWIVNSFMEDLSDEDVLVRPVPAANNIAWQIGHCTASEIDLVKMELPEAIYPPIPPALKSHQPTGANKGIPPGGYLKKAEYLDWFNKVRAATIANVERLSDADLDKPTVGIMKEMAPTLGAVLMLVANHSLMHAGQFSVVRRALNKPVLF